MSILNTLQKRWTSPKKKFLITEKKKYILEDLTKINLDFLDDIKQGDLVCLIGDFDPISIISLIKLLDLGAIVAPLTDKTEVDHKKYFKILKPQFVIKNNIILKKSPDLSNNIFLKKLREENESGLIFFSSGTSGDPKAIVHKTSMLLKRFLTPRIGYRTLNFLMFDHMGGINTLLHTIYNVGTIIGTKDRTVSGILSLCSKFDIEVLPATPTFLRMMLISGLIPENVPSSLKIITYGTEKMDQITLDQLCAILPDIEFRQTYGLSEFSVLRVKSKSRNSLFIKIGGEGVETKILNNTLYIRSKFAMLGYINEKNPFDKNNWFDTKDIVEQENGYIKIVGRKTDLVNVGGLKFMLSDVSNAILKHNEIDQINVYSKNNNITGQHVEAIIQLREKSNISKADLLKYFKTILPSHMTPKKITFDKIMLNHRLKKNLNFK